MQEHSNNTLAACKFCKGSINARFSDLIAHSHSKKHTKAAEPFSSKRQKKLPFEVISQDCKLRRAIIEASLSLFVTCHSAFLPIDHLSELTKKCFKDNSAAGKLKLHRTKFCGKKCIVSVLQRKFANGYR